MKRFFSILMLFALTAATSCSDNDDYTPVMIPGSFGDDLLDCNGDAIVYETFQSTVMGTLFTYSNILTAMEYASTIEGAKIFDGILYNYDDDTTTVSVGSYYNDWYGSFDSFGGFILSKNYTSTASSSYEYQFHVLASSAADSSEAFLAAYYDSYSGGYATPTIELSEDRTLDYIYFANSPLVTAYTHTSQFAVTVTGYNDGAEVGSQDVVLIDASGNAAFSNWSKVEFDLSGSVDKITFSVSTLDYNAPCYFCIDGVTFE